MMAGCFLRFEFLLLFLSHPVLGVFFLGCSSSLLRLCHLILPSSVVLYFLLPLSLSSSSFYFPFHFYLSPPPPVRVILWFSFRPFRALICLPSFSRLSFFLFHHEFRPPSPPSPLEMLSGQVVSVPLFCTFYSVVVLMLDFRLTLSALPSRTRVQVVVK
ncbi:hypothetical protein GALMADRAFT_1291590 [Galerina marginata CBS 339.88]|uniref:Uncharacterized protein n=1 Tax=Galerina marginata (strain CBS 339.88) TaxID=685588 RepID=A0A067S3P7_GALM3|nr:hypothetical protein GALMADRAFT_1291590 [Galerina marginata CBS 339.88]